MTKRINLLISTKFLYPKDFRTESIEYKKKYFTRLMDMDDLPSTWTSKNVRSLIGIVKSAVALR